MNDWLPFMPSENWRDARCCYRPKEWATPDYSDVWQGGAESFALTPDQRFALVIPGEGVDAVLVDLCSGRALRRFPYASHAADVSLDGRFAAFGGPHYRVRIVNLLTGDARDFGRLTDPLTAVKFLPDGQRLIAANSVYTIRSGRVAVKLQMLGSQPFCVALAHDAKSAAFGGMDYVRQIDLATGRMLRDFPVVHEWTCAIALSPDGRWLLAGGENAAVLWNFETGALHYRFPRINRQVRTAAFSPNGKALMIDNDVWDFEPHLGKLTHRNFLRHIPAPHCLQFLRDNRHAVLGNLGVGPLVIDTLLP